MCLIVREKSDGAHGKEEKRERSGKIKGQEQGIERKGIERKGKERKGKDKVR